MSWLDLPERTEAFVRRELDILKKDFSETRDVMIATGFSGEEMAIISYLKLDFNLAIDIKKS